MAESHVQPFQGWRGAPTAEQFEAVRLEVYKETRGLMGMIPLMLEVEKRLKAQGYALEPEEAQEVQSEPDSERSLTYGRFDPGSTTEEDSDEESEPDDVVIITDEVKTIQENLDKRIYSRETMLRLIPWTKQFTPLLERLRLAQSVQRYSLEVSNNVFERRYHKEHGSYPSVDGVVKPYTVLRRGEDVWGRRCPLYKRNPPFGGKPVRPAKVVKTLMKVTKKLPFRKYQFAGTRGALLPEGPNKIDWIVKSNLVKIVHVDVDNQNRLVTNEPGGVTTVHRAVPPARHHTKYWYFRRKRGYFSTSLHHPYGDEAEVYNLHGRNVQLTSMEL